MYQQTTNFLCYFSYDYYGDFIIRLLLRWLVESWSCCPWRINEILNLNGPLGRSSHLSNVFLSIVQQEFLENWRYLFRMQSRRNSVAFKSVTAPDWHWIRRVDSIWSDYTLIAIYSQKPYFRFPTFIFPIPYLQIFLIKHFVRIFLDPWKTKRNGQKQKTKIKANDKSIWWITIIVLYLVSIGCIFWFNQSNISQFTQSKLNNVLLNWSIGISGGRAINPVTIKEGE